MTLPNTDGMLRLRCANAALKPVTNRPIPGLYLESPPDISLTAYQ